MKERVASRCSTQVGIPAEASPNQHPEEPGSTPEDASRGGRIRTYDFLLPKLELAVLVEVLACPECAPKVMQVIRMHLGARGGRHTEPAYSRRARSIGSGGGDFDER